MREMDMDNSRSSGSFWTSRAGIVTLCFLAIAAFFLLTEHTAHVFGVLPYLLIAACPLMHLFMHHGHGGHEGHHHRTDDRTTDRRNSEPQQP
ncbi:MAG TPA: DUF2933 domain-containing protein [Stellaceae bacterium]|nr:DUF2933 domain-containing protein [Stellaceae bacterium]